VPSHRADAAGLVPTRRQQRSRSTRAGRRATQRAKSSSLTVSQAGIASALGLATIAAPISGVLSISTPAKAVLNEIETPRLAAPAFPLREHVATAVEQVRLIPDEFADSTVPAALAAPRTLLVTKPSRGRERAVLPGCFGTFPLVKADNGQLPASMLCTLWDGKHQMRADAAVALAKLNVAYTQEFGHAMCVTDGYRSLSRQYQVKAARGGYAARPGTSIHGLGRAVDLCGGIESGGTVEHRWMVDNAPRYGFTNPDWAHYGGGGPYEPWHWEYETEGESASSQPDGE